MIPSSFTWHFGSFLFGFVTSCFFRSLLLWPTHRQIALLFSAAFWVQKTVFAFVREVTFKFQIHCPIEFFLDEIPQGKRKKKLFLRYAHTGRTFTTSGCVHFAARIGSLCVMMCGPCMASSSTLTKAYMAGRTSCSFAVCIHSFSKKMGFQGGLLLSTL